MAKLDGYTTTKIIRDNGYNNIIIATTGDETATQIRNDYLYFDSILFKPFDNVAIEKILEKFN